MANLGGYMLHGSELLPARTLFVGLSRTEKMLNDSVPPPRSLLLGGFPPSLLLRSCISNYSHRRPVLPFALTTIMHYNLLVKNKQQPPTAKTSTLTSKNEGWNGKST